MLREAHSLGIQLFVVSNKPRHIAVRILEREGVSSLFNSVVTRDSGSPYLMRQGADDRTSSPRLSAGAARCIMVGDTAEDALAAAEMLVPFIWMAHGYGAIPPSMDVASSHQSFPELLPAVAKEFAQ